ncbi:DNA-directed RNA polymerase subunit delta [Bacillus sp. FJAT-47783]|uniref:DNA-directed RNA polymerase subunit delta n=1 Tax=Bacillus sp. FJAT-47783 TaxID=2922712 RepID=UPI001FACD053|nr:DNA-directed RNA polymerase subunit delta [Bacillus sp. FJAT-47783]
MSLTQYSPAQLKEMSMVEVAYLILSEKKQAITFKELMDEITHALDLTQSEIEERIAQFYTDLNIDGRFICIGENNWGLRSWYPYDQIEEETQPVMKSKKKKAKKVSDDLDDLEEEIDLEDLDAFEEDDDFDAEDEEEDDDFDSDDEILEDDEFDLDEEEEDLDDELDVEDEEEDL